MNRMTATILTLALAASAAWAADPPADAPKKSDAELLYEAILAENTKEADKAYGVYLAALAKANEAVLKKLEATKKDLNDMKKFPKLDIAARAAAIAEIDSKIAEVKKGAVGEAVVAKRDVNELLGGAAKVDLAKAIVGRWQSEDGKEWWIFDETNASSSLTGGKDKRYSISNETVNVTAAAIGKKGMASFTIQDGKLIRDIDGNKIVLVKTK